MIGILFILYVILFLVSIANSLPIGWLLVSSIFICLYCIITLFSKTEKLTDFGKIVFILSIFGIVYAICILQGYNIFAMF